MRMFLAVIAVIVIAVIGLYVFGLTLQPDTRTIEQDAIGSANA
ncbi:MAG: hypothetical protein AAB227_00835 [Pseudomonadota bacterium]